LGRSIMAYRAHTIGGKVRYETPKGGGVRITCHLQCRSHNKLAPAC
jgi:nitrate/nitrite-specific signal transduction histidine kinase